MTSYKHLFNSHSGKLSDKWLSYIDIYDEIYADFQGRDINILEIGVQNGGSLEVSAMYFELAKNIVGVDINDDCGKLMFDDARVSVVVGDATSSETEEKITKISERYDIIVDDGSHTSSDIIKNFSRYFPKLSEGGVYIVEDLHCSYWKDFEGGLSYEFSSISFFKKIIDIINHESWGNNFERAEILQYFAKKFDFEISETELEKIKSIKFLNSLCILRKGKKGESKLGSRVHTGSADMVVSKNKLSGIPSINESHNPYASIISPLHHQLEIKNEEITDLRKRIDKFNAENERKNFEIRELNRKLNNIVSTRIYRLLRFFGALKY